MAEGRGSRRSRRGHRPKDLDGDVVPGSSLSATAARPSEKIWRFHSHLLQVLTRTTAMVRCASIFSHEGLGRMKKVDRLRRAAALWEGREELGFGGGTVGGG